MHTDNYNKNDTTRNVWGLANNTNTDACTGISFDAPEGNNATRSTNAYLTKRVSSFPSADNSGTSNGTRTVMEFLDACKHGVYQEQIEVVRAVPDKKERDTLKEKLPAVTIQAEVCRQRSITHCKNNGVFCLDFDGIKDMEKARQAISAVPYIFAVCMSASGRGLFALAALAEPAEDLEPVLVAMRVDFTYPIDPSCSEVNRLRYVSYDPDLILKERVIPFQLRMETLYDADLSMPVVNEPCLQNILRHIEPIDFYRVSDKKNNRHIPVVCIEQVLKLAYEGKLGLCTRNEMVYCYTGAYWKLIDVADFKTFLTAAAIKLGVPRIDAKHHQFGEELFKQFLCAAHLPAPEVTGETKINLRNGTFVVSESGRTRQEFNPADFLNYQLPFDYDPAATAPMFQAHLNKVLPEQELQDILAESVGSVFAPDLNLEKVALLLGGGSNGKSVIADIIHALLGKENVSGFSLHSITRAGSWVRAEMENKLLNYSSEISSKLEPDMFKKLVSREPVEAHRKYKDPYMMTRYARMMFNCNVLPRDVELTDGFFRRLLIIPFRVTIPEAEQVKDLARQIIATELSGVFNWVLAGLSRLLTQKKFTHSAIVQELVETYRIESDSAALFLHESGIKPGAQKLFLKSLYEEYREFCKDNGYHPVSNINFASRLRALGFSDEKSRGGRVFFCDRESNPPGRRVFPRPRHY